MASNRKDLRGATQFRAQVWSMTAAERWPTEKRDFSTEIILPEGESCQRDVMRRP
jgi:hypothetical protein